MRNLRKLLVIASFALTVVPEILAFNTNAVKLTASDGFPFNGFGQQVGISDGRLLIVGETQAYVFERQGTNWIESAIIPMPDQEPITASAISGDTIALATYDKTRVFERVESDWVLQASLEIPVSGFDYGYSVGLDGNILAVGHWCQPVNCDEFGLGCDCKGVAYVYQRTGSTWALQATVTADDDGRTIVGWPVYVALKGDVLVLGYPGAECDFDCAGSPFPCFPCEPEAEVLCDCQSLGAVYVFVRVGSDWVRVQKLVEPVRQWRSSFGSAFAIHGQTIFVGAPATDIGGITDAGAAHVFAGDGVSWTHQATLSASDKTPNAWFGAALAADTNQLIVSAYNFLEGKVYGFNHQDSSWTQTVTLLTPVGTNGFGSALALADATLVVGAPLESEHIGAAYVFDNSPCRLKVSPLFQDDSRWKTNHYDHSTNITISAKGCAMTSVSMALNFVGITNLTVAGHTVTNTPATLNAFMKARTDNYIGLSVNWAATVSAASNGKWAWEPKKLKSSTELTNALAYLEEIVCATGTPVVVGVKLNAAGNPGHFLLVTGKDGDDFLITDPAGATKKTLADYDNKFETRGHLVPVPETSPAPLRASLAAAATASGWLYVGASDAVELLITDPLGRRAGIAAGTTNELAEIAGAVQFFDTLDNDETDEPATEQSHFIYVRGPATGAFQVTAHPYKDGPVTLILQVLDTTGRLLPPVLIHTNAVTGEPITFEATVDTTPPQSRDLAVVAIKAPKKITLKAGTSPKPGKLSIAIQNLGPAAEVIPDAETLVGLLGLTIESLGDCSAPVPQLVPPKTGFPITLARKKKLKVDFTVLIDCANDTLAGADHADYRYTVSLAATNDTNPADNTCPRPPSSTDKGCNKGLESLTDVVVK